VGGFGKPSFFTGYPPTGGKKKTLRRGEKAQILASGERTPGPAKDPSGRCPFSTSVYFTPARRFCAN